MLRLPAYLEADIALKCLAFAAANLQRSGLTLGGDGIAIGFYSVSATCSDFSDQGGVTIIQVKT